MSTNPSTPQRQAPRAAINPPRANGGSTTPGEIAKAVREASLAAQKTTEAAINRILEATIAANQEEAAKLAKKYRALADMETKVAKQLAELDGKMALNEQQLSEIEDRRKSMEKEAAELKEISEEAERFLSLRMIEEKRIADRFREEVKAKADLAAAQEEYSGRMKIVEYGKTADDAALAAGFSRYSPELEQQLQDIADEYAVQVEEEEAPKPARKKRAPAKKPAARSTKNNDEDEGSDGALPDL